MDKGNFLDEAILIKLQLLDILFQIRMLIFTNMVSVECELGNLLNVSWLRAATGGVLQRKCF